MMIHGKYSRVMLSAGMVMLYVLCELYLCECSHRHSGAHTHRFLLEFIKTVGYRYVKDGRSHDFIVDLLGINVPQLFGLPEDTDKGHPVAVEIQSKFSAFIQSYILLNTLKIGLLQNMDKILVGISELSWSYGLFHLYSISYRKGYRSSLMNSSSLF